MTFPLSFRTRTLALVPLVLLWALPCLAASISGNVSRRTTGAAIGGVEVCARNQIDVDLACDNTDTTGYYSIQGLADGTYYLVADHDLYTLEFRSGKGSFEVADPVRIQSGQSLDHINFLLYFDSRIWGTVYDDQTIEELEFVLVEYYNTANNGYEGSVRTDSLGQYELTELRPGEYRITVRGPSGYNDVGRTMTVTEEGAILENVNFFLSNDEDGAGVAVSANVGCALTAGNRTGAAPWLVLLVASLVALLARGRGA